MKQMFAFFKKQSPEKNVAVLLYRSIVNQARQPVFYTSCAVPDTMEGRFEMLVLHAFLVWDRLQVREEQGAKIAQALFDAMFRDVESGLREMGIGDMGLPRRMKRMMALYKGRAIAYQGAMGDRESLCLLLNRALYAGEKKVESERLAVYMEDNQVALAAQEDANIGAGRITFKDIEENKEP